MVFQGLPVRFYGNWWEWECRLVFVNFLEALASVSLLLVSQGERIMPDPDFYREDLPRHQAKLGQGWGRGTASFRSI